MARYLRSRQTYGGRNQQQQSLLLRYFALPLKEENNRLWLGVDSLSNLPPVKLLRL